MPNSAYQELFALHVISQVVPRILHAYGNQVQSLAMLHYLDLDTWQRVFEFYLPFDKPYFNVCTRPARLNGS